VYEAAKGALAGRKVRRVDEDLCIDCGMCRKTGCPAIMKN
jgi:ferredoxin